MTILELFPRCDKYAPMMQGRLDKAGLTAEQWLKNAADGKYKDVIHPPVEVSSQGQAALVNYFEQIGDIHLMQYISKTVPA